MIEIDNIIVEYKSGGRAIRALDSFSLRVAPGEYLAVLGPNGSGKSTLLRAICGQIRLSGGQVAIDGKMVVFGRFGRDLFGKVGVVFQEPEGQFLMRDVKTEIGSVFENLGLQPEERAARQAELVRRFNLGGMLDTAPDKLSGGQMQIVNLACALASSPAVLLLDEPTTFLDSSYRRILLDHVDFFVALGGTVIHVTQYPDEALRAGRVGIIGSGKLAYLGVPAEAFSDSSMLKKYNLSRPFLLGFRDTFGFDCGDPYSTEQYCSRLKASPVREVSPQVSTPKHEVVIDTDGISYEYPRSRFKLNIDHLSLCRGEVVGLVGPTGSGKSTLAFLLAGLISPNRGEIGLFGKAISSYSESELRGRIGIGWQFPDLTLIGPTVADDIRFGLENLGIENAGIASVLSRVGLEGYEERIVDTLSGGEKRKMVLAGIIACEPDYLILDEPEAFLDPHSQMELAGIIGNLKALSKGALVVAHDFYFLSEAADRIVGLDGGRLAFDISAAAFFSDPSYIEGLGLDADPMISFRQAIARQGIILPMSTLDPVKIASYINGNNL